MSKYLCLSFDDGPNNIPGDTTMKDMLDILEKYEVPGSFFLIGNKITPENKKIIERAVKLGCDIQNHSWTHSFMAKMTAQEIKEEYKCMCKEFREQIADPDFEGYCHCKLYYKSRD